MKPNDMAKYRLVRTNLKLDKTLQIYNVKYIGGRKRKIYDIFHEDPPSFTIMLQYKKFEDPQRESKL